MTPLMPSLAKGNNVFRPSQGTHGAASATLPLTEKSREDPVPTIGVNALSMDPTDGFNHDGEHTSDSDPGDLEDCAVPPPSSPIFPPLSLHHDVVMRPMPGAMPRAILNHESHTSNSSASVSCTSTTTSTSSKRKRSALSASLLSSGKKQRTVVTGAVALNGIKESLDSFNNTIERSLLMQPDRMRSDTSPERRAKAMELFQEQEPELSDDCTVAFIDLFRMDTAAADAYIALKRDGLRKAWIQRQMKDLGHHQT
jgi:hypothetical protein